MNFTYENIGSNTFLVYEVGAEDELDTLSLGMLTNNNIHGFAPTSFMQMDSTRYIKYNVSAKVSVSQLFDGTVNRKRLLGVFSGIVNAMLEAEDYMLEPGSILLDLDHIFADVSTCETVVVCLPLMKVPFKNEDLSKLIKNIMFTTQFDQTENCDHVTQILNFLNSSPVFSLVEFKALLDRLTKGAAPVQQPPRPVYQPQPMQQPVQQMPMQQPPVQPAPMPQPPVQQAPMQQPPVQKPVQAPAQKPMQPPVQQAPQQPPVGFAVPGKPAQQPVQQPPKTAPQQPAGDEEPPMSWLYLMQHYNKENAAKYKAQQDAKKNKEQAAAPAPAPQTNPGFAVPGQQPAGGFAVPGKPAPQQPAGGFAVPGKPAPQQPAGGFAVPGKPAPQPMPQPMQAPMQQPPMQAPMQQPPMQAPMQQPPMQPAQPAYMPQPPVQQGRALNFGETTVLGGGAVGETTVLGGAVEKNRVEPHLIRAKNNEKIPLNKPVFRIGKEKSYVDYFIGDNTAISRSHANIVNHNGEFFVVDTNSTNHTYVNGGMINSNEEIKLSHGTKIRLANEDFEFKLY